MMKCFFGLKNLLWLPLVIVVAVSVGCGEKEESSEAGKETPELAERKRLMREISYRCAGIDKALREDRLDGVVEAAGTIEENMLKVSELYAMAKEEKFVRQAQAFQQNIQNVQAKAQADNVKDTKVAFQEIKTTCGICHYTCEIMVEPEDKKEE